MARSPEVAVFGGGCFWCTEAVFSRLKGVLDTAVGFAGGHTENPSYDAVHEEDTGHAEVVKVEYDPGIISFHDLLTVFFGTHDPTTQNRQGHDVGEEYRSAIFVTTETQQKEAEAFIETLEREGAYKQPIVTEIHSLGQFFRADEDHQRYFEKHPERAYCQIVIAPKIAHLQERFAELVDEEEAG